MQIVPAILTNDINDFWQQIKNLSLYFSHFQIDIADGKLVANKTIQAKDISNSIINHQSSIINLFFDFHLMVVDYKKEIEKLKILSQSMKIKTTFIHLQAIKQSNFQFPTANFPTALVLNPEDDVSANWNLISQFPIVQIMSINPGFQGSPFIPKTLEKINDLRELNYQGLISLDGGINDKTLPIILKNEYRPDILIIGSYLKDDTHHNLNKLKSLINAPKS